MDSLAGLEQLPTEILYQLLVSLSYDQIINFCSTNRQYQERICHNENFWATKARKDFGVPTERFYQLSPQIPSLKYVKLLANIGHKCIYGSEKIIDLNTCLEYVSKEGNLSLNKYFVKKGATNLLVAFYNAVESGNFDLVSYLIQNPQLQSQLHKRELNSALLHAGYSNNRQLIEYLLSLGANNIYGLLLALIENGNLQLIKYLFSRFHNLDYIIYSDALYTAINNKNREIINFLLAEADENNIKLNLTNSVRLAAFNNDFILVDQLFIKQPIILNLVSALNGAAKGGHLNLVKHILDDLWITSSPPTINQLNTALLEAAKGGSIAVINYLLAKGAIDLNQVFLTIFTDKQINVMYAILKHWTNLVNYHPNILVPTSNMLNELFRKASEDENLYLMELLIFTGTININNLNKVLLIATKSKNVKLVNLLLSSRSFDIKILNLALQISAEVGNLTLTKMLLASGANDIRNAISYSYNIVGDYLRSYLEQTTSKKI